MAHRRTTMNGLGAGGLLAVVIAMVGLLPTAALAEDPVGRVLVAAGGVTAKQDGVSARGLGRNDPVYAGDTIRTGSRGRAQIRFKDGGLVDLKPSTRFAIDSYAGEADDGNVVLSFLRGAMRTITGAIGTDPGESYRMETPVATIGVRGTAYALQYCDEACAADGGQEGLYGRVDEGRIVARNERGEAVFGSGAFFSVEAGGAPQRIVAPPSGVLDGSGDTVEGEASDGEGDGEAVAGAFGGTSEADRVISRETDTTQQTSLTEAEFEAADEVDEIDDREPDDGASSGDGAMGGGDDGMNGGGGDDGMTGGGGGTGDGGQDVVNEFPIRGDIMFAGALDGDSDNNALVLPTPSGATDPFVGDVVPQDFATLEGAQPTIEESGATVVSDNSGEFEVQWVRWSIPLDTNQDGVSDGDGRIAFAFTDVANVTPESSLTGGSASYGLASGPLALGSAGGLWGFEVIGIDANFTEGVASLQDFSLFKQNGSGFISLDAVATGAIEASTSTLEFSNVRLSGQGSYNGDVNGVFVGEGGEALVIGFRLDENGGSNTISGVQIVK